MNDDDEDKTPVMFGVLVLVFVLAIGFALGLLTLSGNCIGV